MELIRLSACDYEDATDFLNMVFSTAHCPMEFRSMIPLIYQPTEEKMRCNFAVRENGKIRAIVGLFPAEMQVGDTVLKLGGIGGVSSHPNDRGRGWMKALMNRVDEEMMADGTDLSWLGGLRQRYQYYGYEKTGILLSYEISDTNIRHHFAGQEPQLHFVPIGEHDQNYLTAARALHDAQPLYCHRAPEEFYLYCLSENTIPYAALTAEGQFAGYLCARAKSRSITECFPAEGVDAGEMIHSWIAEHHAKEVTVLLAPWQKAAARSLAAIAENWSPIDNDNWKIYHWDRVVGALLHVKARDTILPNGTLSIGIQGYGTLEICIENGTVRCEMTDAEPQIIWDSFTAMRVLFGHAPAIYSAEIPEELQHTVHAWFPLPLSWLVQNHV